MLSCPSLRGPCLLLIFTIGSLSLHWNCGVTLVATCAREQTLSAGARPLQTPLTWRSDQGEQAKQRVICQSSQSENASDSYLFQWRGAAFYRWRRKSCVRRSWRNPWAAKYGRRSHGCRRRIRRIPYGGGTANVGVLEEMRSLTLILSTEGPDSREMFTSPMGEVVGQGDQTIRGAWANSSRITGGVGDMIPLSEVLTLVQLAVGCLLLTESLAISKNCLPAAIYIPDDVDDVGSRHVITKGAEGSKAALEEILQKSQYITTEVALVLLISSAILIIVPFKYILAFFLFDLFTRRLEFRREMVTKFTSLLKERWAIFPVAAALWSYYLTKAVGPGRQAKQEKSTTFENPNQVRVVIRDQNTAN
ncbi:chromosome-partitioning protein, putative [Actinidia rufa]|uniref:Chromosome-partitioning protein, putative n=1 Tax=Actinidia rufa TaxID=165716 RepID=A0A7J0ES99_9ERIC|nr:chromosome-partitioning protein, putative [Actinidia rufa]